VIHLLELLAHSIICLKSAFLSQDLVVKNFFNFNLTKITQIFLKVTLLKKTLSVFSQFPFLKLIYRQEKFKRFYSNFFFKTNSTSKKRSHVFTPKLFFKTNSTSKKRSYVFTPKLFFKFNSTRKNKCVFTSI
jgi:hypothetical protein